MSRLAKNLILATAVVSATFIVDLSSVEAANFDLDNYNDSKQYLDFWSKFRDTVMPDPDEPQNNNPPKPVENEPPEDRSAPKPVEKSQD